MLHHRRMLPISSPWSSIFSRSTSGNGRFLCHLAGNDQFTNLYKLSKLADFSKDSLKITTYGME